jgi:hypothetical protein
MPLLKRARCELTFGESQPGWRPVDSAPFPADHFESIAVELTVSETDDGFILESSSASSRYSGGDSWHCSLDEALLQAHHQFGVPPDAWSDVRGRGQTSLVLSGKLT